MLFLILTLILLPTLLDIVSAGRVQVQRLAASPVSLPMARRVNLTSVHNLVRHDRARAQRFRSMSSARADPSLLNAVNVPVDNQAITYVASVAIGDPPTTYSLVIDTGSSNTWAGAQKLYQFTKTTMLTLDEVIVVYGSGTFIGLAVLDKITLAPGLTIANQSLGAAQVANGFDGVDGILGIGPTDLTIGTLFPDKKLPVKTVVDNLYENGAIASRQVAIYFQPVVNNIMLNGEMTFGGINPLKNASEITWTQVTATSPASAYWGINQALRYGESTTILPNTAGIVDTGTTLVLLATDAFNTYKSATGAILDSTTGLLSITPDQYAKLQSLFFTVENTIFEMTPDAQLWPRVLNTLIGGSASAIYLIVGDLGIPSGSGLDFINGYGFLERFYSVFDTDNKRVGLATTSYTYSVVNYPV
ncbi:hypothetical protein GALMADRAFT_708895 [Galerina marginata CBS 339.88]|uniref:Peptidase A1 domain-containing protein n=1 Tax=Galerina marginata (strain CBS 339.88) TaxID=685588 RepID=A0A067TM85_GALM3|nr:hypothetical protein GALMADRAFT_708895 [Galerina marginata CBS 339.88]